MDGSGLTAISYLAEGRAAGGRTLGDEPFRGLDERECGTILFRMIREILLL